MREFLFKGKQISNDEWVEGSLLIDEKGNHYIGTYIPKYTPDTYMIPARGMGKTMTRFVGMGFVMVDPETVGQYTGLTDKNGKKIFEGDIVRHYNNFADSTKYEIGKVFWGEEYCGWRRTTNRATNLECVDSYRMSGKSVYEVIGNIHDNPELLKDGEHHE